jgi:hypothetical protein
MVRTTTRRRGAIAVVVVLLMSLIAETSATTPAGAQDMPEPENIAPTGGTFATNPVFTWDPIPGYDREYRIQISTNADFSSNEFNLRTFNTRFAPPA